MPMREQLRELISTAIKPLRNVVYSMVSRVVVESINDSKELQLLKINILAGESRSNIEHFQNFGFTSRAPDGAEAVALSVAGDRSHLIVLCVNDRKTRIKDLEKGEAVLHNAFGQALFIRKDGLLDGKVKKIKFENDTAELIDLLTQTLTAIGVEPFIVNKTTFSAIKTKMDTFKV